MGIHRKTNVFLLALFCAGCGSDPAAPPPVDPPIEPPVEVPAAQGWSVITTAPISPGGDRHDDIVFVGNDGWLVNTRGEIHRTTDGGATWALQFSENSTFFRAVGFADSQTGWVGNLNGFNNPDPEKALYETLDGGTTWTNITPQIQGPEPIGICGIWVVNADTVYAVGRWNGPAIFVRTHDGGQTWESFDLAPLASGLVDVRFFDGERGMVVGGRGVGNSPAEQESSVSVILWTEDGGDTWAERYVSTQTGTWAWKIAQPSPQVGYVAEQGPASAGRVIKTSDGGLTWNEQLVGDSLGFSGIGFASPTLGWVAADRLTWETRDGGATWSPVRLGDAVNRFRMDGPTGFAAGRQVYRFRM